MAWVTPFKSLISRSDEINSVIIQDKSFFAKKQFSRIPNYVHSNSDPYFSYITHKLNVITCVSLRIHIFKPRRLHDFLTFRSIHMKKNVFLGVILNSLLQVIFRLSEKSLGRLSNERISNYRSIIR